MQIISLTTGLAAALLATSVAADTEWNKNSTGTSPDRAKVVNNCAYKVYLWSILKGQGCPSNEAVVLNPGDFYHERYRKDAAESEIGVSIKISKTNQCKGVDITQLEYFQEVKNKAYEMNFLDVSYVDCLGGECPGRNDGYYLKAGNTDSITVADASNPNCPTFKCHDKASCDKTSYVNWDDVQTKSCGLTQPLDFYLCGESPQAAPKPKPEEPKPVPSSSEEKTPEPTKTPVKQEVKVAAAQVTSAPAVPEVPKLPNVKTEVVYVTQVEYVNAKRHAHQHAHKHFRA